MDAETAASEMAVLRGAQDQRESWLREHPDAVSYTHLDVYKRQGQHLRVLASDVGRSEVPSMSHQL